MQNSTHYDYIINQLLDTAKINIRHFLKKGTSDLTEELLHVVGDFRDYPTARKLFEKLVINKAITAPLTAETDKRHLKSFNKPDTRGLTAFIYVGNVVPAFRFVLNNIDKSNIKTSSVVSTGAIGEGF